MDIYIGLAIFLSIMFITLIGFLVWWFIRITDPDVRKQIKEEEEGYNAYLYPHSLGRDSKLFVCAYILKHKNEDMTAQSIADATGVGIKAVNGIVTGLQKLGATIREDVPVINGRIRYIRVIDEKEIQEWMYK